MEKKFYLLVPFVIECYIHTDNLSMNVHVLYVATKFFSFQRFVFNIIQHELQYNLGGRGWTKKKGKKEEMISEGMALCGGRAW